ncbi:hypothetical protein [Methyloceanibacter sp.]|uniref:hypothetical protein n=1 Tax=Methyloceanibacter sp. TaxID=1965321 RepID=UPI003D6C9EBE
MTNISAISLLSSLMALACASTLLATAFPSTVASQGFTCQWDLTGHWELRQTNGILVNLDLQQRGPLFTGSAGTPEFFGTGSRGSLDGSVDNQSKFKMSIYWDNGAIGEYTGTVNQNGRLEGETYDRMSPASMARWFSTGTGGKCLGGLLGPAPQPAPKKPAEPDPGKGLQSPGKFFQH